MSKMRATSLRLGQCAELVEFLEQRVLLSAVISSAGNGSTIETLPIIVQEKIPIVQLDVVSNTTLAAPFMPAALRSAYGVSGISFNGTAASGAGQTIAIVDAYNDPDILSDASTFSSEFGLPQFNAPGEPTLQLANETGGSSVSAVSNSPVGTWDVEESLDVEWAHTIAPQANIILYEANTPGLSDLLTAVESAANAPGVSTVSMSWGGSEFAGESSYDQYFTTPAGHQPVTFLASTGDSGEPSEYPAYSPNVVAVGGTTVTINSDDSYNSESAWADGGGGVSTQESIPSYQLGKINGLSSTNRATPDVAMDANPSSGVYVLDSYYSSGYFLEVGGTSLAAPMWSGLVAIADQGRAISGLTSLNGATQTLPALYSLPGSDFHDVTTGSNGFSAGPGYDLATGLGTPAANLLVPALAAYGTSSIGVAPTITTNPVSQTALAGAQITFTAAATGTPTPTVQWYISSGGTGYSTIAGATSTTLTVTNEPSATNSVSYEAIFSNSLGTATTAAATLTLGSTPVIIENPLSQTVIAGTNVNLNVATTATPIPTTQWMLSTNGGSSFSAIAGATFTSLSLSAVTLSESGYKYEAVFTNTFGSTTTAVATLTVTAAPIAPTITTNPQSQSVVAGALTAVFTSAASGTPTPTVQWEVSTNGGASFSTLAGATGTTLGLANISTSENGYEFKAIFANTAGTATTTAATLTVTSASAASLTGTESAAAASYNLTALGTSDWAHWGRAGNSGNFDHDSAGGSQISNVTRLGSGSGGGWTYSGRDVIWSNGTPTASASGDDGYIWANNAIGAGYSFTVPASTTSRTVYVYLGGNSSGGTLDAHLSDGSAGDYSVTVSGSGNYQDLVAITYTAASAGQTLTLSYTKTQTIGSAGGSVDLIAAWLTGSGSVASSAPTITTNPQSQSVVAGTAVKFSAAATGTPTPTIQWELSTGGGASFAPISGATAATFSIGTATVGESGYEYEAVFTNTVGTATTAPATLTVTPASVSTGSLSGSSASAAASYNLTALGTSDWTHWGRAGSAGSFDHDSAGGSQISNVTQLGTGSYGGWTDSGRNAIWSNGSPTAADPGDDGYIWANNAIGAGYSFTVPASTASRTLSIYLGGSSAGGTLTAALSDGSAPNYSALLSGSGNFQGVVTITFAAASAGQTLDLSYTKTQTIGSAGGSVDLMAAWLGGAPAVSGPTISTNPRSQSVIAGANVTFTAIASGTPAPTVQWQLSTNGGGSFTPISNATTTTLSIGATTVSESGYEYEAVFTNTAGTATTSPATLTVSAASSTGSISGSGSTAAAAYNLSALGTTDWAHWGRGANAAHFDHDASGGSQISNISQLGSGSYGGYSNPVRNVSWTNGAPTAADAGDSGYLWANNAIGAGYSFTVPASTTTHTVYIYLGGNSSGGTLTAALSDNSAASYSVSLSGSGTYQNVVAVTYKAASAGQTLTLSWVKSQTIGSAGGSVDLIAAWLQ